MKRRHRLLPVGKREFRDLTAVRQPLQEALRTDPVWTDARLDSRPYAALGPANYSRKWKRDISPRWYGPGANSVTVFPGHSSQGSIYPKVGVRTIRANSKPRKLGAAETSLFCSVEFPDTAKVVRC
jgi:hypothetical protein